MSALSYYVFEGRPQGREVEFQRTQCRWRLLQLLVASDLLQLIGCSRCLGGTEVCHRALQGVREPLQLARVSCANGGPDLFQQRGVLCQEDLRDFAQQRLITANPIEYCGPIYTVVQNCYP